MYVRHPKMMDILVKIMHIIIILCVKTDIDYLKYNGISLLNAHLLINFDKDAMDGKSLGRKNLSKNTKKQLLKILWVRHSIYNFDIT